jgi:DNA-binding beta-propeller fold protein YncE
VTTLAGSPGEHGSVDGIGNAARFDHPWGIAADISGNVFVADTDNHMVRKITPAGMVTTLAGTNRIFRSSHGREPVSEFFAPRGIAVDGSGNVFVANFTAVHQITPAGKVTTLAGLAHIRGSDDGMGGAAWFHFACGIALDTAGNLYVTDSANYTIRKGVRAQRR